MSLQLEQAADFREDFALRARWFVREAGGEVARRYQEAVDSTLRLLCAQPEMGRKRRFRHPLLQGLRSFPVQRPFPPAPHLLPHGR
jgi:plasmid stabilization system protein ParE